MNASYLPSLCVSDFCDKGTFYDATSTKSPKCTPCPVNQYQDVAPAKTTCNKCPDGKGTVAEGSKDPKADCKGQLTHSVFLENCPLNLQYI